MSAFTSQSKPKPASAPRIMPQGTIRYLSVSCLVSSADAPDMKRVHRNATSISTYTPYTTASGGRGKGGLSGEIGARKRQPTGVSPTRAECTPHGAHPVVGLQLVDGLAKHLQPELAADKFHYVQYIDEALAISRHPAWAVVDGY
jgi:hypothetical protein